MQTNPKRPARPSRPNAPTRGRVGRRTSYRLPSYRPCASENCVAGHCDLSKPEEPCWGGVTSSGDYFGECLLHACEGHSWSFSVPYRPSDRPEDAFA